MSTEERWFNRRQFIQWGVLGAIAWTASACGLDSPAKEPDVNLTETQLPTTTKPPSPTVTPTSVMKILRNENRESFYIRYFKPFPAVDPNVWRLDVKGLVGRERSFNLADLLAFEHAEMEARMKCVECWSARATWGGFTYQTLAELVRPKPEAAFLRFGCADGYWEILAINEMTNPRALFVTHMNGELLSDEYGAPLRLMLPWKYGYKSAKAIVSVEFTDKSGPGYWSSVGPYTVGGDIEAGFDNPLDLQSKTSRRIAGGEITDY